jgi:hypothetical protein
LNRISPPKAPINEQTLDFAGDEISNSSLPPGEPLKIPAARHSTSKNADEAVHAIGFRNRLLAIRLSVLAEPCQVLFLFCIFFFDARSLHPQIMIAWRAVTIGKRFPIAVHCLGWES